MTSERPKGTMYPGDPLEDVCRRCGAHVGYGHPAFHLGVCDACSKVMETKRAKARLERALHVAACRATEQAEWRCVGRWLHTGRLAILPADAFTTLGTGSSTRPSLTVLAVINPQGEIVLRAT